MDRDEGADRAQHSDGAGTGGGTKETRVEDHVDALGCLGDHIQADALPLADLAALPSIRAPDCNSSGVPGPH